MPALKRKRRKNKRRGEKEGGGIFFFGLAGRKNKWNEIPFISVSSVCPQNVGQVSRTWIKLPEPEIFRC